jgi:translation initiation factor IF-3
MRNQKNRSKKNEPQHRINSDIRVSEVRLTGDNAPNAGEVVSTNYAQRLADDMELDLVEINSKANPSICQIVDYKKFLYEEKKRQKDLAKKQKEKTKDLKEMQFKPNIDDNDLSIKRKKIVEFLEKGHKVKVSMRFSGREKYVEAIVNKGEFILLTLANELGEISKPDNLPKLSGSSMLMTLSPKK